MTSFDMSHKEASKGIMYKAPIVEFSVSQFGTDFFHLKSNSLLGFSKFLLALVFDSFFVKKYWALRSSHPTRIIYSVQLLRMVSLIQPT